MGVKNNIAGCRADDGTQDGMEVQRCRADVDELKTAWKAFTFAQKKVRAKSVAQRLKSLADVKTATTDEDIRRVKTVSDAASALLSTGRGPKSIACRETPSDASNVGNSKSRPPPATHWHCTFFFFLPLPLRPSRRRTKHSQPCIHE